MSSSYGVGVKLGGDAVRAAGVEAAGGARPKAKGKGKKGRGGGEVRALGRGQSDTQAPIINNPLGYAWLYSTK